MLDEIPGNTIREGMIEQLHMAFDGLANAMSLRSTQDLGTDQSLNEVVAEMNACGNRS